MVAFPTVAWWWQLDVRWIVGLGLAGALIEVTAWVAPRFVKPVYVGCLLLTAPIGYIVGELTILLIFLTVFCPLGVLFRVIGRDVLERTVDRNAMTYWKDKEQPKSLSSYYRQS
ncbi:MAG TPA: hypothetical protein EYQ75_01660 [Planctomycetaceae bacterium]|nr:hypothetical protein [Planctomycetaceae bacterium]